MIFNLCPLVTQLAPVLLTRLYSRLEVVVLSTHRPGHSRGLAAVAPKITQVGKKCPLMIYNISAIGSAQ